MLDQYGAHVQARAAAANLEDTAPEAAGAEGPTAMELDAGAQVAEPAAAPAAPAPEGASEEGADDDEVVMLQVGTRLCQALVLLFFQAWYALLHE